MIARSTRRPSSPLSSDAQRARAADTPSSTQTPRIGHTAAAEHQRGAEEQRAGHHAKHEPVDRRLEAAVVEVDVEFAGLHLLQDVSDPARQHFGQLLELAVDAPQLSSPAALAIIRRCSIIFRCMRLKDFQQ